MCNLSLFRLVDDGLVLADPVEVPLDGATSFLPLGFRWADSLAIIPATDGTTNQFLRHDGVDQDTIPFGDTLELLGFSVSRAGDINFLGITVDTHEKVIGSIAADSVELDILSSEQVNPDAVVSFTRIN